VQKNRNISYANGEVGITSLLYYPLKVKYRKLFPEMKSEAIAIEVQNL